MIYNETVRGDMGLETLKGRSDRAKLMWWGKLVKMPGGRYAKQLFSQGRNVKPHRCRQRKMWGKVGDILTSLCINKCGWFEDIKKEEGSLASFMACVEESIKERDNEEFEKGLDIKVNLAMYKTFGKNIEYKDFAWSWRCWNKTFV